MEPLCQSIITILILLAFLFSPQIALAQSLEPITALTVAESYTIQMAMSPQNPTTLVAKWPHTAPRIIQVKRYNPTPLNCVSTLKSAGLLPNKQVTVDGFARTIPTEPLKIKEGEKAVIKTTEGKGTGHVLQVTKKDGNLISTVEGGYRNGVGRVVPPSVVVGEVSLPTPKLLAPAK